MWVPVVSFVFLLLARDVPLFLEQYGSALSAGELAAFDALTPDYEPLTVPALAVSRSASATAAVLEQNRGGEARQGGVGFSIG